jgi:peptidoglycan/LPS O-acetylase OafA/YrhL
MNDLLKRYGYLMVKQSKTYNHSDNSRFWILDLIRILAALWVATYHLTGGHGWFEFLKHPYGNVLLEGKLGLLSSPVRLGFLGVPIFFVISGFVIVQSSKNKSPTEFLVTRFSRLAPGFIFSILLTVSFYNYGYRGEHSLNLNDVISTIGLAWEHTQSNPIQGSYWTLWPEVRFYGLFLIFVLLFYRSTKFTRKAALFFMAWLISLWFIGGNPGAASSILIGDFACYFILGGLLALGQDLKKFWGLSPFVFGSGLIVFLNLRELIYRSGATRPIDQYVGTAVFIISVMLIGFSGRISLKSNVTKRIFLSLGRATYVFYLLQEGIGMPITSFLVTEGMQIRYAIPISLLTVSGIAVIFTEFFEQKLIALIKKNLHTGLRNVLE